MRAFAIAVLGFLLSASADASEVRVPMRVDTAFVRELLVERVFTDPGQTARAFSEAGGCTQVTLLRPEVGTAGGTLLVTSDVEASFGTLLFGRCFLPMSWQGRIESVLAPSLESEQPIVRFRVTDSTLLERDGTFAGATGTLWNWVKSYVHPRLELVAIDFALPVREVGSVLPMFLSEPDAERARTLVDSLALDSVAVGDGGVTVTLRLEAPLGEPEPPTPPAERALGEEELARFRAALARWDGFVTFVVKHAVGTSSDPSAREQLFEILMDARYRIIELLEAPSSSGTDPVRPLFVSTWQRLADILREIGPSRSGGDAFRWLGFIASADALAALDALGPQMGVEISEDGLRRLARVVAPDDPDDPLATPTAVDPELRRAFGFGPPLPEPVPEEAPPEESAPSPTPPSSWLAPRRLLGLLDPTGWIVAVAHAATLPGGDSTALGREELAKLNRWVPTRAELPVYLPTVRALLRSTATDTARSKSLAPAYRTLYGDLQLATAWQETCWRQNVRVRGVIRPLRSSAGAVGLMQVNSRAWRGFYDARALEADIAYNGRAGSEILLHYLVDLALERGEHRRAGGVENLVRATYAAYNGGPSHLRRYRRATTPKSLRAIDASLFEKYEAVRAGRELEVARCFG